MPGGEFEGPSICLISLNEHVTEKQHNGTLHREVPRPHARADAALIASAPALYGQHEADLVDLDLLLAAINADDPKAHLRIRIADMARRKRVALSLANPSPTDRGGM